MRGAGTNGFRKPDLTMYLPFQAFVWETWAGHRCAWITIASIFIGCALCSELSALQCKVGPADCGLVSLAAFTLGLLMSAFNFTEVGPRKGFAGFPQRLFTLPVARAGWWRGRWCAQWCAWSRLRGLGDDYLSAVG